MPPLTRDEVERILEWTEPVFQDRDLSLCDLSNLEFNSLDFQRAKLAGANLAGVLSDSSDFGQVDLTGANLSGASFVTCDFGLANLTGADLTDTSFVSCQFTGVRFDGAAVKGTNFESCEFEGADWRGAVVKRCTFDSCEGIVGLPPHKIYQTLSDMPEDAQKLEVCRARFAPLQALLGGAVQGTAEDTACALAGEFRGRAFRVDVDFYDGRPTLHLDTRETEDVWFYLYRDPKRRAKAEAAGAAGENDLLHFLSESVYLEEESREELDACLAVLSRLRPETRQALIEAMETFRLNQVEIADDHIEGDFKKDILVLDLTQSVPRLLDLFAQLADAAEAGAGGAVPATATVAGTEPVAAPVTAPVAAPMPEPPMPSTPSTPVTAPASAPESSSFDLSKRCRHCGTIIPWGEFECPSCHKYF